MKDLNLSSKTSQESKDSQEQIQPQRNTPLPDLNQIYRIYKYKLSKLYADYYLKLKFQMFWELLDHNSEGEIERKAFILLFSKIYKLILPLFNYEQILNFLESEWLSANKGRKTLNMSMFSKYLFRFTHCWCTHINRAEYLDFLGTIYERITKLVKINSEGKEQFFLPSIRVRIYKAVTPNEYEEKTWEVFDESKTMNKHLYELPTVDLNQLEQDGNNISYLTSLARPLIENGYLIAGPMLIYSEEVHYPNHDDIYTLDLCETVKRVLLEDDEIIIYGYPSQFIMTHFKNNINILKNLTEANFDECYLFKITDHKPYLQHHFECKFEDEASLKDITEKLEKSNYLILTKDIFLIDDTVEIGIDFVDDQLNIFNNLRRNTVLDRYLNFQEVLLPDEKLIANVDHLIISPRIKKALQNIITPKEKIGIKSHLWSEKIHDKIERIIRSKFYLVHIKILNFLVNIAAFSSIVDIIQKEIEEENNLICEQAERDFSYFKKFASKNGIISDRWDSDYDIIDEANKKSPVVLIIGPPMVGKTKISEKLSKDMDLVHLSPKIFFDSIFTKEAEFEEKMLDYQEPEDDQQDNDDNDVKKEQVAKPKPKRPEVDSVLTQLEYDVYKELKGGHDVSKGNLIEIYRLILHSDLAQGKGLLIDHQSVIGDEESLIEMLIDGTFGRVEVTHLVDLRISKEELDLRLKSIKYNLKTLDRVSARDIELMHKPKAIVKEKFEDEEVDEDENTPEVEQIEPTEEELENIPKEADLLEITDKTEIYNRQYENYTSALHPKVREHFAHLHTNFNIVLDVTGLDVDQSVDLIKTKLDFFICPRPIAKALPAADYKELLQVERDGILPYRRWSLWKQIDPVALKDEYVILNGSTEFAVDYLSRVFLFVSEENRKKFITNPKKYLKAKPAVPTYYRVCVIGSGKSGKKTIASILSEMFGWMVVNMDQIYEEVKEYQKNFTEPEINSVYSTQIHFSAAEYKDMMLVKKDKKVENFYSKIIFMLDHLGIKLDKKKSLEEFLSQKNFNQAKLAHLMKKITKIVEEKEKTVDLNVEEAIAEMHNGDENYNNNADHNSGENSLNQEAMHKLVIEQGHEANVDLNLEEQEAQEEEDPFPPEEDYPIEDLRSDQFYYAFNDDGTYPRPGGFILLGHPNSQEEIDKFLEFNITFDKVIYLVDQAEDTPNSFATRRNPLFPNMDETKQGIEVERITNEKAKCDEAIAAIREKYNKNNEDCVLEVNCMDSIENIRHKLLFDLDPFYTRIDPEDKIYAASDVNNEEKFSIPRGEYGMFCPVTLKEHGWLYSALDTFEVQVNQRLYRFATEKDMEAFKMNPSYYLEPSMCNVTIPPPHLFVTGYIGAGVTHFTNFLCKEYQLKKREIKGEFLEIWDKERLERREVRVKKKRSELIARNEEIKQNNLANPDAEPEELLVVETELANDPTLDEEDEGYNQVENDKKIFRHLFYPDTPSIYDATWYDMEEKVPTPLVDLMVNTKRTPNVLIAVHVTLKTIMERHYHEDQVKEHYNTLLAESNERRQKREDELIHQKKIEILDNLRQSLDDNLNDDNVDVNNSSNNNITAILNNSLNKTQLPDISAIKIELEPEEKEEIWNSTDPELIELETLIAAEKDKLTARHEANVNIIAALIEQAKEKGIPVIEINNDQNVTNVQQELVSSLYSYIKNRDNLIEQQLICTIKLEENVFPLRKIKDLVTQSEVYKLSSYGRFSPINPHQLVIRTDYPLIYRDRIYLFNTEEEKQTFSQHPLTYKTGREFPLDSFPAVGRDVIYTVGLPQSGKTTIAKTLSEKMGYTRMTIKRACMDVFKTLQDCLLKREIEEVLRSGSSIDDNLAIKILSRRLSLSDICNDNVVIDGFPYTLSQADLLFTYDQAIVPTYIFIAECGDKTIYDRCKRQNGFKSIPEVINERVNNARDHLKDIIKSFNIKSYDVRYFNTEKSKWFIKDQIKDMLEHKRKSEMLFSSNYNRNEPACLNNFIPKKLRNDITLKLQQSKPHHILLYSSVGLKTKNEFAYTKHNNNSSENSIILYQDGFHFLKDEEEVKQFSKSPGLYKAYLIDGEIQPPKKLGYEKIAEVLYKDPIFDDESDESGEINGDNMKLGLNLHFEYQDCCPVSIALEKTMKVGKACYVASHNGKFYKFDSFDKMKRFLTTPHRFENMSVNVKKVLTDNDQLEKQINFENTVNYLEGNFGALITKGMLEISSNRIKYPHLHVKESCIKYLALFLKANNPNNNQYSKEKYTEKLNEVLKSSKLPFELLNTHNKYQKENEGLKKDLMRKQLNTISERYDDLIEKAKIQKNNRFNNFFKKQVD